MYWCGKARCMCVCSYVRVCMCVWVSVVLRECGRGLVNPQCRADAVITPWRHVRHFVSIRVLPSFRPLIQNTLKSSPTPVTPDWIGVTHGGKSEHEVVVGGRVPLVCQCVCADGPGNWVRTVGERPLLTCTAQRMLATFYAPSLLSHLYPHSTRPTVAWLLTLRAFTNYD